MKQALRRHLRFLLGRIARGRLRTALSETLQLRLQASGPWLRGRGLEIGAGPNPQPLPQGCECRYYDLRTDAELQELFAGHAGTPVPVRPLAAARQDFPAGADFVLAHNVLEHCADPIGALREWHRLLAPGATMVLTLPDRRYCADRLRPVPPLEHLLLDHALRRDQHHFDSREHIFSFVLGWNDEGAFAGKPKAEVAEMAAWCAGHEPSNDCHWHAFDETLGRGLVRAAAALDGRRAELLNVATPPGQTHCELVYVYRLAAGSDATATAELAAAAAALEAGAARLRAGPPA